MADVKVEKQNKTESQGSTQNQAQQSSSLQPSGQQSRGNIARHNAWTPSMFSLGPREFFSTSPFELMRRFSEEMDRAFENFGFAQGGSSNSQNWWAPALEVFERDNNVVVRAELPGLNKDDVKVEVTDEGLIIQGERKREHEDRGEGWYRSERSYGQFYRHIPLPEGANYDQAKAQFENGILEIEVPVPESNRRRRSIPIETGGKSQTAQGGSNK